PTSSDEPVIVATTQQSRFHVDTLETLSNDIDLKQVNITIGDLPILVDANLQLFQGVHYGLIGRNGVGKSTLLKCMGYKLLIGFPKNIRVLYVEQLETTDPSTRVIDVVLDADGKAKRYKAEVEILQAAQESHDDEDLARAVRKINMQRLLLEMEDIREKAIKRSGARGLQARYQQVEMEAAVVEMKKKHQLPVSADEVLAAPIVANSMLEEMYAHLDMLNSSAAEAKARKLLKGLGFSEAWQNGPLSQLSGGWRIRASLTQALFMEPDVLLLDEPTNHLDLPAILWLQNYLVDMPVTMLIVSHDRAFLNATTTETVVMKNQTLTYHTGNYDEYLKDKEDKQKRDVRRQEAMDKKKAHIEKSIQEAVKSAKRSGDDKKLTQAASRQKKLDDRWGLEVSAKGHRFKLNRDLVGYFLTHRVGIEFEQADAAVNWSIPEPEPLRNKASLLEVEDVSFAYPGGPTILSHVTLNVQMGEKIAIVGANGEGKTTLANLIAGQLQPNKGHIQHHSSARMAYVAQHHITDVPPDETPLSLLRSQHPDEPEPALRAHLGGFGIGALATRPISQLSGGQRVRVVVAVAVYGGKHLLLLDEPTHHLDMDTVEAMVESLKRFSGAVLAVSHDQYFLSIFVDRAYVI
ncbi:P-loop containing nucleoside triphosphate hydrolase protein, partial [Zopfochytrium polystomum]